jgi:hypothetical protein
LHLGSAGTIPVSAISSTNYASVSAAPQQGNGSSSATDDDLAARIARIRSASSKAL